MTGRLLLVPTDNTARLQGPPHIPLADIRVGQRMRTDLGDIDELAASISELGLLQPILLNPQFSLVAGLRRLEACRQLGAGMSFNPWEPGGIMRPITAGNVIAGAAGGTGVTGAVPAHLYEAG